MSRESLFLPLYYTLIGLSAAIGLLVVSYWTLRRGSSLGFLLFHNTPEYMFWYSLLTIGSALLFGLSSVLFVHQWRFYGKPQLWTAGSNTTGAILGMVGSACPICGTTILAGVGIVGSLSVLPFRGLEIKAVAVTLLFSSAIWTLWRMYQYHCDVAYCPRPKNQVFRLKEHLLLGCLTVSLALLFSVGWHLSRSDPFFSPDPKLQSMLYQCSSPVRTL